MDVVSHLVFGRALSTLVPRPAAARGLTTAVVLGSIVPDADAVVMATGWDRYLLWHQRGTHALIGTIADALVFALVLHLLLPWLSRWRESQRTAPGHDIAIVVSHERHRPPDRPTVAGHPPVAARYGHLFAAAWVGCLGHLLLDLISGGTIRLFSPFSQQAYGTAWMAMADPLLAVPLLLFLIATFIWRTPARTRSLAIVTLSVLAAIVGVKELSRRAAVRAYHRHVTTRAGEAASSLALEAAWGTWTRWWAFDREGDRLRAWELDTRRHYTRLAFTRETSITATAGRSPAQIAGLLEASTHLDTVRHLGSLFDLTFPEVMVEGDRTVVRWTDIRFCGPSFCGLWFGGTFDAEARPIDQFVIIGTYKQTRAP